MNKWAWIAAIAFLGAAPTTAQITNQASIRSNGWIVTANGSSATLTIAHDALGTVLEGVRLNLRGERGLLPLTRWSVERKGERQLAVRTARHRTAWVFTLNTNTLEVSSTSTEAVLTATAPASPDRVVARVLDPQDIPVTWKGTNEVASGYGGSETINPSYLPAINPECMYFGLGQVSGSNFHSLFDRRADIAISFTSETRLQRNTLKPDALDVTIPVPGNSLIRLTPDYYTKVLGVPYYVQFDDSYFKIPPMVWSSWTSYYEDVTEQDIVRNTDWIAGHLKPYGFEYVQLDDGYDRMGHRQHSWIEHWNKVKFPHGPQWLTNHIRSKGLHAGLWLVPNAYAGALEQHPDWYLRDKEGQIILDYNTPALDSTNPEVLSFLRHLFTTLDDWGFEYYKFDGEHALPKYVPAVDIRKLYSPAADPLVTYRNRLELIRTILGPKRFIEGCPAGTPLNGIGYFNSYFNGHDVYNNWQGMYALFSSINANAFLNHMVVYVMPGEGMEVGPRMTVEEAIRKRSPILIQTERQREDPVTGLGVTLAEARTLVSYVSLTGVAYPLASVLPELPEERIRLLKMSLPTMPILPIDLFSRGTDAQWNTFKHTTPDFYIHNYPEILDLKVNAKSGIYDVVGVTNWRSEPASRDISFAGKLGLSADASYAVFDFWNQQFLGTFKHHISLKIAPHDTRVLFVHPVLNRPQLVGISRHISGAYSILNLKWDAATGTLSGSSETVAADPYTLWVTIPSRTSLTRVITAANGHEVTEHHRLSGGALAVTFEGTGRPVNWELEFTGPSAR